MLPFGRTASPHTLYPIMEKRTRINLIFNFKNDFIMKVNSKLLILICFLSAYSTLAQISTPIDFSKNVKYQESTTTFFVTDSTENLTALDKSHLNFIEEVQIVEKFYTTENNMPITLIEKVESKGLYEEWMIKPSKLLIDFNGVKAYDALGNLIKSIPHTDKYLEIASKRESNIFYSFLEANNSNLQELQNIGYVTSFSPDGSVVATSQNGTLIYNEAKKMQTVSRNDENGDPISVTTTKYISVKSINPLHPNNEDVVPVYSKEIVKKVLPSGACTKLVRVRQFENYEILDGSQAGLRSPGNDKNKQKAGFISLSPNPVSKSLNILNSGQSELTINIYNLNGQVIKTLITTNSNIDISELFNGIYIISIQSSSEETISKFIKI